MVQTLATDPGSPIKDVFNPELRVDMEGKRHASYAVAKMEFVDMDRIVAAAAECGGGHWLMHQPCGSPVRFDLHAGTLPSGCYYLNSPMNWRSMIEVARQNCRSGCVCGGVVVVGGVSSMP
jgi:hypothetical protein